MRIYAFITLILLIFFAGCAVRENSGVNQDIANYRLQQNWVGSAAQPAENEPKGEAVVAEPNGVLTLRDVLALTLMRNPALKVYSYEIRAAQARELQAGLWPNPELGVEVEDVGGSGPRSGFDAAETTIGISQLIELGDKAQKRKTVASFEKDLAGWDYQTKRLEVLTGAGKAFIELLAMQEKTSLLGELVEISERMAQSVRQRVEAGKDAPVEKTKAAVALSGVRLEYQQALLELRKVRTFAASFWDNEHPVFTRAEGPLEMVSDIPQIEALQQKLMQNPQLARWEKDIARSKAALELERAKSLPDISVGGGVKRFNETDDNAFVFGITIPLPISDRNQGGRMEAAANLSKSYAGQRVARIEAANQFHQIFTELSISHEKIKEYQTSILPAAREVFTVSQRAYSEGKIDYLHVLDAQRTYFVSQTEYLGALVSYHKAKIDMEELVGQLPEAASLIKPRPFDGVQDKVSQITQIQQLL